MNFCSERIQPTNGNYIPLLMIASRPALYSEWLKTDYARGAHAERPWYQTNG